VFPCVPLPLCSPVVLFGSWSKTPKSHPGTPRGMDNFDEEKKDPSYVPPPGCATLDLMLEQRTTKKRKLEETAKTAKTTSPQVLWATIISPPPPTPIWPPLLSPPPPTPIWPPLPPGPPPPQAFSDTASPQTASVAEKTAKHLSYQMSQQIRQLQDRVTFLEKFVRH